MSLSNGEQNRQHEGTLLFWRRYHLLSWRPLQSLLLAQKSLWVKVRLRQGACTSVLFAACRSLHLIQSWYVCFSSYALSIRSELQPGRWDADEWWDESCGCVLPWEPRGAGCHWSFPAKGKGRAAAVSSALLPRGGKSTDMVSWDPNLPTWSPHQQGLQSSSNAYWELPGRIHICIS